MVAVAAVTPYDLPPDWSLYWTTCAACGRRYHASGADPCACWRCEQCDRPYPPSAGEGPLCEACASAPDEGGAE